MGERVLGVKRPRCGYFVRHATTISEAKGDVDPRDALLGLAVQAVIRLV
jgi:hypothetical protein